jgi:hypothetical protein
METLLDHPTIFFLQMKKHTSTNKQVYEEKGKK